MHNFKILSVLLVLLITLAAGYYPFFKKRQLKKAWEFPLGESLAAGVFLGAALMHMLSDSADGFRAAGYHYPFAFLLAGIAFLVLLLLEHIGRELYEHKGESAPGFAILAVIMLSLHSFLTGAALGLTNSLSVGVVLMLAIIAHKWAASFSLSIHINKSSLSWQLGLMYFVIFAVMTPLGILFGSTITNHLKNVALLEPIFSALAAGTFLYLGTLHGLKQAVLVEKCCSLKRFCFVIIGFGIMALVAVVM
jgi:zinc transporter 1/2/3